MYYKIINTILSQYNLVFISSFFFLDPKQISLNDYDYAPKLVLQRCYRKFDNLL